MLSFSYSLVVALGLYTLSTANAQYPYVIGDLSTNHHDVSGTVAAINSVTLRIGKFVYDGKGPDASFWADTADKATPNGVRVPFRSTCDAPTLGEYDGSESVILDLPKGYEIGKLGYLSVYCIPYSIDFGGLVIPKSIPGLPEKPSNACGANKEPRVVDADDGSSIYLGSLEDFAIFKISGDIYAMDNNHIMIRNFTYAGDAPGAWFWVNIGPIPGLAGGVNVPVVPCCANGAVGASPGGRDVLLELPEGYEVGRGLYFSVYCIPEDVALGGTALKKIELPSPSYLSCNKCSIGQQCFS